MKPGFDPRSPIANGQKVTRGGIIVDGRHNAETLPSPALPSKNALPNELYGQEAPPDFIPNGKTLLACHLTSVNLKLSDIIEITENQARSMGANTVEARVLSVGPEVTRFSVGERLLVHDAVGTGVCIRGKLYRIIREEDVMGKFTSEE